MSNERSDGAGGDEYTPADDSPEAKLYREDDRQMTRLLASLTPEDAHRHLFTFQEITQWLIKNGRFRHRRR